MTTSISSVTVEDLLSNAAWARRLALNLLSDRDCADDLVQETWIATLRARPDASQSLRPWLARVLRNRAATHSRDDARRAARHDRAADVALETAGADPEALLGRMQVQRLLAELIAGLPEPGRQTVLLRYYEGLTSERIGEVMGVAPGTVRRRLKEAIDELRVELDRRHQGKRDTWVLALLPIGTQLEPGEFALAAAGPAGGASSKPPAGPASLPPVPTAARSASGARSRLMLLGPAGVPSPRVAIGALVVSLAAGGLLLAWPGHRSQPPGGGAAAAERSGNGRGGGPRLAAALVGTFEPCRQALAARRKELAAAEKIYRDRAPKDVLFEQGTLNPTARAALLPLIERITREDVDAGVSFSLECRTWACRVLVLRPEEMSKATACPSCSLSEIPEDPDMAQRIRGSSVLPDSLTRDPVSGAPYTEAPIYLVLKKPSGAPVAGLPPAFEPATDAPPEPRTREACQSELQAAEERLTYIRRVNEDRMSLPERFRESAFDPLLTLDIRAAAGRVLRAAGEPRLPEVVCRGRACRLSLPGHATPESWQQKLARDPAFSRRISETTVSPDALIVAIHASGPGRENRVQEMLQQGKDILGAVDLHACASRSPAAAGDLVIGFVFPITRRAPKPGDPPHAIVVRIRGSLAGTPIGRCVEQEVARLAAAATPPADLPGGSVTITRTFPLDPTAADGGPPRH